MDDQRTDREGGGMKVVLALVAILAVLLVVFFINAILGAYATKEI